MTISGGAMSKAEVRQAVADLQPDYSDEAWPFIQELEARYSPRELAARLATLLMLESAVKKVAAL